MGAYLCIARNEVPPAVSKRVYLRVNCEYFRAVDYYFARNFDKIPIAGIIKRRLATTATGYRSDTVRPPVYPFARFFLREKRRILFKRSRNWLP